MVDYRKLLDAVVGAFAKPDQGQAQQVSGGSDKPVDRAHGSLSDHSTDQLLQKAKDLAQQHPGLTQAALLGLAGLMLGKRKKGGVSGSLVKWGGLAVIGGLAYRAYQSQRAGKPASGMTNLSDSPLSGAPTPESAGIDLPETSRFHPVSQTEDDALLYLRTMVAAAAADGQVDQIERTRIVHGLVEAGIDPQATRWLEREMESPASVDELADGVDDPEKAAQVYAAALLAIDPDTLQEHEFLRQLAEALDLEPTMRTQIEETIGAVR
ncbi:tellurite resistance TerB family protein [Microvirga sp. 2TAF3]|uniref:tellurite resistance TerB family protein n=1 Tax=Microvirga sp. 2TAF3 TaxID=3233014 RepID=UPI003F9D6375